MSSDCQHGHVNAAWTVISTFVIAMMTAAGHGFPHDALSSFTSDCPGAMGCVGFERMQHSGLADSWDRKCQSRICLVIVPFHRFVNAAVSRCVEDVKTESVQLFLVVRPDAQQGFEKPNVPWRL